MGYQMVNTSKRARGKWFSFLEQKDVNLLKLIGGCVLDMVLHVYQRQQWQFGFTFWTGSQQTTDMPRPGQAHIVANPENIPQGKMLWGHPCFNVTGTFSVVLYCRWSISLADWGRWWAVVSLFLTHKKRQQVCNGDGPLYPDCRNSSHKLVKWCIFFLH